MYHISRKDLGNTAVLSPKIPKYISKEEDQTTHRVCFSPSVHQCLAALRGFPIDWKLNVFNMLGEMCDEPIHLVVYRTDQTLHKPTICGDYEQSDEHWSFDPVTVTRVGYIDIHKLLQTEEISITDDPKKVTLDLKNDICRYLSTVEIDAILKVYDDRITAGKTAVNNTEIK